MFRRKDAEDSLFGNEFTEENESFNVIEPAANSSAAPAAASAPQTVVAPPAASMQPLTRPSAPIPVGQHQPAANTFRSVANVAASTAPLPTSTSRTTEVKSMTPISIPSASAQSGNKPTSRVLTVGNDILLKGEINSCDRLVIEGKLEATLNDVHTVELAECGSFKGSANVVEAQISGLFEGDLVVTGRLVIYASGKVRGNISYGEIEIERGGELSGSIKMAGSASQMPKALRKEAA